MQRFILGLALLLASLAAFSGKPCTSCTDVAPVVVTGTFTGTGSSASPQMYGTFNIELSGTWTGTVVLERSFDGGTTFIAAAKDTSGSAASYTANVSIVVNEVEPGVLYRWRCSTFGSGTIAYRISGGPRLT